MHSKCPHVVQRIPILTDDPPLTLMDESLVARLQTRFPHSHSEKNTNAPRSRRCRSGKNTHAFPQPSHTRRWMRSASSTSRRKAKLPHVHTARVGAFRCGPAPRQRSKKEQVSWGSEPNQNVSRCTVAMTRPNVGPITGRAGAEPRSTERNYTAGPVRCIGGLCTTPRGRG